VSSSEAVTRRIRVRVEAEYAPEQSLPMHNRWFFRYTVAVANEGPHDVQLVSRHWIITDARGKVEEVKGPGVVGEQPNLAPGASFQYTSGCMLATSRGTMRGTYQMIRDAAPTADESTFDAEIAPFALELPVTMN